MTKFEEEYRKRISELAEPYLKEIAKFFHYELHCRVYCNIDENPLINLYIWNPANEMTFNLYFSTIQKRYVMAGDSIDQIVGPADYNKLLIPPKRLMSTYPLGWSKENGILIPKEELKKEFPRQKGFVQMFVNFSY